MIIQDEDDEEDGDKEKCQMSSSFFAASKPVCDLNKML